MTIASSPASKGRVIAVCAASLLLHALAIGWVATQEGPADPGSAARPEPIVAVLLKPAAPPPAARPSALAPKPAPPSRPRRAPVRAPVREMAPVVAEPVPEQVALAQPAPESLALPDLGPVVEAPPEQPAEQPAALRYRVSLPPTARLSYDVARKDAKGAEFSGSSEVAWQQGSGAYRVQAETFLNALIARVSVMRSTSEGAVTEDGIAPRRMLEKRMGRGETATHFDADAGRITFSRSERSVTLAPGAQDRASLPFQLAGIARADSSQLSAGVEIQVGSERDATPYAFVVAGEETIDTPMGPLATWRLTRAPRAGSYSARLDIWLAPQHGWLPVQVRSLEANGALTTQTIRRIVADAGIE